MAPLLLSCLLVLAAALPASSAAARAPQGHAHMHNAHAHHDAKPERHHSAANTTSAAPSFAISGDLFVKDGAPFTILSGEIHFWRMAPADWDARLAAVAGMGYNTITVYAHWALTEPEPNSFDFGGGKNLTAFIALAWARYGLHCICRVGPYITAETDFGGLPYWLSLDPAVQLRSMNFAYLAYVNRYFDRLLPQLVPLQYNEHGGPIVLVQVEDDTSTLAISVNETRSYYAYLVVALRRRGITALANTLCYPVPTQCERAIVPDAILAVEMPYWVPPAFAFDMIRAYYPRGPLIVMETYSGFFDVEGKLPHVTLDGAVFADHMRTILDTHNASLSIYMAFGGSNFGFSNGAEHPVYAGPVLVTPYAADTTSYDYDAPVGEAGQIRSPKYFLLRALLGARNPAFNASIPPPASPPIATYGSIALSAWVPLLEVLPRFRNASGAHPVGMEQLQQGFGYVLYLATTTQAHPAGTNITVTGTLQDRALVLVDGRLQCVITEALTCRLPSAVGARAGIAVLVENKGRPSGEVIDFRYARKGIYGTVHLGAEPLSPWTSVSLPLSEPLSALPFRPVPASTPQGPAFFRGTFTVGGSPQQTFLLTPGWGKGVVLINGFNVGRFTNLGPQCSLYVPAAALREGTNELIVFESDAPAAASPPRQMTSTDEQLWLNDQGVCA